VSRFWCVCQQTHHACCLALPTHLQALPLQQLQQAAAQLQRVGGLAGPGAAETAAEAAAAVAAAAAAGGAPGSSDVSGDPFFWLADCHLFHADRRPAYACHLHATYASIRMLP
jgi:hypothetical protein